MLVIAIVLALIGPDHFTALIERPIQLDGFLLSGCTPGGVGAHIPMKIIYVFPTLLIILDIGAAIVWGIDGNWRQFLYWLFAAGLTFVVTF